ncbi:hypothetical protein BSKO_12030 [Bryopsis sp. KO-2023]|nr:hypothetical protein BSKO_12030 [Bryopsis sp. KO-2023]
MMMGSSTSACRFVVYSLSTLGLGFWLGTVCRIDRDSAFTGIRHRFRLNGQTTVLPASPSGGETDSRNEAHDVRGCATDAQELVLSSGSVFGKVKKQGLPPIRYWYTPDASQVLNKFSAWLSDELVFLRRPTPQPGPPLSSSCTALVNEAYKFIFVKNPKTAGTSIFLFFGGLCSDANKNHTSCLRVLGHTEHSNTREKAALAWENYFVFTISRNPFSRAGSAYDYMLGLRPSEKRNGPCSDPPFSAFCKDPFVIGRQDRVFQCNQGHDSIHDFYHVEPQHRCTTTRDGNLAVDFILRYENLQQDFDTLLGHLNRLRNPGLAELSGTLGWQQKGPLLKHRDDAGGETVEDSVVRSPKNHSSGHLQKFVQNEGVCIDGISQYYRGDFDVFRFPLSC